MLTQSRLQQYLLLFKRQKSYKYPLIQLKASSLLLQSLSAFSVTLAVSLPGQQQQPFRPMRIAGILSSPFRLLFPALAGAPLAAGKQAGAKSNVRLPQTEQERKKCWLAATRTGEGSQEMLIHFGGTSDLELELSC
jgi:hypothetical protein